MIDSIIDFCTKRHSATELAVCGLPNFPTTKVGVFLRFRLLGIQRHKRKHGGGFEFSFFDFPESLQRSIILFFVRQWQANENNQTTDKEIVDTVLFACASRDLKFAEYWRRREMERAKIHEKIIRLLER
jgi:hypothetical protein